MTDELQPKVYITDLFNPGEMCAPDDQAYWRKQKHSGYVTLQQYNELLERYKARGSMIAKLKGQIKSLVVHINRK